MSGRSARTIRNFSLELWQDLVLHGIRKSTFHNFRKYWNINVPEMAFKTLHIVQGLSRTPLLFILRYLTNLFLKIKNLEIWKSKSLEKTRARK